MAAQLLKYSKRIYLFALGDFLCIYTELQASAAWTHLSKQTHIVSSAVMSFISLACSKESFPWFMTSVVGRMLLLTAFTVARTSNMSLVYLLYHYNLLAPL